MDAVLRKPGWTARAALGLIGLYQRWISPRKGFRCAHAVLNGGPGCSGFAKSAIREHGLWQGLGLLRQRFRDCRAAMHILLAQQSGPPGDDLNEADLTEEELETARRQRKKRKPGWFDRNDCALAACEAPAGCCSVGSSKGAAAGGAAAGLGAEATTGICGATAAGVGEGIAGACGVVAGGFSCCG